MTRDKTQAVAEAAALASTALLAGGAVYAHLVGSSETTTLDYTTPAFGAPLASATASPGVRQQLRRSAQVQGALAAAGALACLGVWAMGGETVVFDVVASTQRANAVSVVDVVGPEPWGLASLSLLSTIPGALAALSRAPPENSVATGENAKAESERLRLWWSGQATRAGVALVSLGTVMYCVLRKK